MLRLDDQLGTLAPGMLADVLVVDGDPLSEIAVIADPARRALVLKGGAPAAGQLASLGVRQPEAIPVQV